MLDRTRENGSTLTEALKRLLDHPPGDEADSRAALDRAVRATLAQATRGLSPVTIAIAYADWLAHLALSPGKLLDLLQRLAGHCVALGMYQAAMLLGRDLKPPTAVDRHLRSAAWQRWPFNMLAGCHAVARDVVRNATAGVDGVSPQHERLVSFLSEQVVELLSPANTPLTNPEVIAATIDDRGENLRRGFGYLVDDVRRRREGRLPAAVDRYRIGEDIAVTPGKVVFQNALAELIQYEPATSQVGTEPVFILPAWIMKYYILDLQPERSLVRYLVEQGKTVFILSWKNPVADDAGFGMDDYLRHGLLDALDAIETITGCERVHAVGYCLGGTLLTIGAAYLAREGDDRLKTLTTFASQIDFSEAGEVQTYLDESSYRFLSAKMEREGFLGIDNLVDAFKILRPVDQVYAPAVDRYLKGRDREISALMRWNLDGTRLPYRMHREYLKQCYLDNNLARAKYCVGGRPVCVGDIRAPAFVLGTETDHVAPWKSVYKAHLLMHDELTFVLTTAGHNAGIVSGPTHARRRHRVRVRRPGEPYVDPDTWLATTALRDGSWWPTWNDWLDERMDGQRKPPPTGARDRGYPIVRDAPGEFVFD